MQKSIKAITLLFAASWTCTFGEGGKKQEHDYNPRYGNMACCIRHMARAWTQFSNSIVGLKGYSHILFTACYSFVCVCVRYLCLRSFASKLRYYRIKEMLHNKRLNKRNPDWLALEFEGCEGGLRDMIGQYQSQTCRWTDTILKPWLSHHEDYGGSASKSFKNRKCQWVLNDELIWIFLLFFPPAVTSNVRIPKILDLTS